ncbi:hypothetical protein AMK19_29425 [Kitasatospora sp. CB01950]|nr:hypothetical protein AMK19_29425 [Kitasatospora sp. CB01950]
MIRTVRQLAGERNAGEQLPVAQRTATVGRPAAAPGDERSDERSDKRTDERTVEHRARGHRALQAGRWAAAALAPDQSARPAPSAPPEAPAVDLTRRTPRGASALGRPSADIASVPAPTPAEPKPVVIDAEQLAANPTDAELLTPARIAGVGHAPTPGRTSGRAPTPAPASDQDGSQVRLRPVHATELRSAGQFGQTGHAGSVAGPVAGRAQAVAGEGGASAVRRRAVGDENGSE